MNGSISTCVHVADRRDAGARPHPAGTLTRGAGSFQSAENETMKMTTDASTLLAIAERQATEIAGSSPEHRNKAECIAAACRMVRAAIEALPEPQAAEITREINQ